MLQTALKLPLFETFVPPQCDSVRRNCSVTWQRQCQKSVTTMSKLSMLIRSMCRNSSPKGFWKKIVLEIVGNFFEKSSAKECGFDKVGSLTLNCLGSTERLFIRKQPAAENCRFFDYLCSFTWYQIEKGSNYSEEHLLQGECFSLVYSILRHNIFNEKTCTVNRLLFLICF